ncbi:MAG: sensor histidine kinase [Bacteroidetes bacterium]|nr:sensor histidine kinase [Bacteroidota bacterium]
MLLPAAFPLKTHAQSAGSIRIGSAGNAQIQPADTLTVNRLNEQVGRALITRNADSLLQMAQTAVSLATRLQYKPGLAVALRLKGCCNRLKGDYPAALGSLLGSLRIAETLKSPGKEADAYRELALLQKDLSGSNQTEAYLEKGIEYSRLSYALAGEARDSSGMVNSLNMEGIIYRDKAKTWGRRTYYDTAYDAYNKALALIAHGGRGIENLAKLYNNISQVFIEYKGDYRTGLDYLLRAVHINDSTHSLNGLSHNYGNISGTYLSLHESALALAYARKMLAVSQLLQRPERLENAYRQLYNVFKANGLPDSALYYYVQADDLNDSLTNLNKVRQVTDLQAKYETAKKETEIIRLQTESREKNKRIALLVIALAILAGLAACMIWLYRRVVRQRQRIAAQSAELELMMKELHHRVKNNLQIVSSLLSLQTSKLRDESAIEALKESQLRVQAMSFIHQRLYKKDSVTEVNMKEYLTDLVELLLSSYGYVRDGFDLAISVQKEMLDIDRALPIGLIINEMVTNSLKYAYAGVDRPSLEIALTDNGEQLVCRVKDNGCGMDESGWQQKSPSFGKQLITALCRQLRAQHTLVVNRGVQFTITIPKQAA